MVPTPTNTHVQLEIGGMTCASCAARIEKRLNKLDGVTATVNYATEKATVDAAPGVLPVDLIAEVEAAGYAARLPQPLVTDAGEPGDDEPDDPTRPLRDRLVGSAALMGVHRVSSLAGEARSEPPTGQHSSCAGRRVLRLDRASVGR